MKQAAPALCVQQQWHRQPCCAGTRLLRLQQRQPPLSCSRQQHRRYRAAGSQDSSRGDNDAGLLQQPPPQQQQQQQQWQQQPSSTLGVEPGFQQQQQQQRPSTGHITASLQNGSAGGPAPEDPQQQQQQQQQQPYSSTPAPRQPPTSQQITPQQPPQQQPTPAGMPAAINPSSSSSSSSEPHKQQQQQQPWPPDVPWGLNTIVGVLSLWLLAYVAIGQLLVPAVLALLDLERGAMSARELALLNLCVDCFQAALTLLMLAKCLGRYRPRTRGLFPLRWQGGAWLPWVAGGVGCFPVIDWVWKRGTSLLTGADVQSDMFHTQIELGLYTGDVITIGCYVIIVGLLAPLWEEVLFRGFLLPSLAKLVTPWPAVSLTALLFAWMHSSSEAIVPLLLVALGCGALLVRFDNLLPPILLHGLYNLYVFANMAVQLYAGCGPVTASLSVAFGAAGVLLAAAAAMRLRGGRRGGGGSSSSGGGSSGSSSGSSSGGDGAGGVQPPPPAVSA